MGNLRRQNVNVDFGRDPTEQDGPSIRYPRRPAPMTCRLSDGAKEAAKQSAGNNNGCQRNKKMPRNASGAAPRGAVAPGGAAGRDQGFAMAADEEEHGNCTQHDNGMDKRHPYRWVSSAAHSNEIGSVSIAGWSIVARNPLNCRMRVVTNRTHNEFSLWLSSIGKHQLVDFVLGAFSGGARVPRGNRGLSGFV